MYQSQRRFRNQSLTPEEIEVRRALWRYDITNDTTSFVPTRVLYRTYKRYKRGLTTPTLDMTHFGIALRQVYVLLRANPKLRVRRNGVMGFCCMKKVYYGRNETPATAATLQRVEKYPEDRDDAKIMA